MHDALRYKACKSTFDISFTFGAKLMQNYMQNEVLHLQALHKCLVKLRFTSALLLYL